MKVFQYRTIRSAPEVNISTPTPQPREARLPGLQDPTPIVLSAVETSQRLNLLAILDEAEAAQTGVQGLTRPSALAIELTTTRVLLAREQETVKQLHQALSSRDTIGQAKGILMERHKISAHLAFAALQEESSRNNQKLINVAEQLIYTGLEETH